jgi:hypothetical protein
MAPDRFLSSSNAFTAITNNPLCPFHGVDVTNGG